MPVESKTRDGVVQIVDGCAPLRHVGDDLARGLAAFVALDVIDLLLTVGRTSEIELLCDACPTVCPPVQRGRSRCFALGAERRTLPVIH
jgi:hypothetical protein